MRKTKIICTMGPAVDDDGILRKVILNGMDCARFNFSHGSHEEHAQRIARVKRLSAGLGIPVALMLDTKGPEIRVKDFAGGFVILEPGAQFTLHADSQVMGSVEGVAVTYPYLAEEVSIGTTILIDDGLIALEVTGFKGCDVVCKVRNGGKVSNHKSINIPGVFIDMPYISPDDRSDILFGIEQGVDFIAASFVRTANDVQKLRKLLDVNGGRRIQIISKIENASGVEHLDAIIESCDGIMVARGDMGVEIPFKELPPIQKEIIGKCYRAGKYVVTATQMLESMTYHPRPTRAEVSDVANAIYDGTTVLMLSGETAAGQYPVEAVTTMAEIAEYTESKIDYETRFVKSRLNLGRDVVNAIGSSACDASYFLEAKAIICVSMTGRTARVVSHYRPACPVLATVTNEMACRQLKLSYGILPLLADVQPTVDDSVVHACNLAKATGIIDVGDLMIITCGSAIGTETSADTMLIKTMS